MSNLDFRSSRGYRTNVRCGPGCSSFQLAGDPAPSSHVGCSSQLVAPSQHRAPGSYPPMAWGLDPPPTLGTTEQMFDASLQIVHKIILNCSQICARARISYVLPGHEQVFDISTKKKGRLLVPFSHYSDFGKSVPYIVETTTTTFALYFDGINVGIQMRRSH